jgi:hypothetical protein
MASASSCRVRVRSLCSCGAIWNHARGNRGTLQDRKTSNRARRIQLAVATSVRGGGCFQGWDRRVRACTSSISSMLAGSRCNERRDALAGGRIRQPNSGCLDLVQDFGEAVPFLLYSAPACRFRSKEIFSENLTQPARARSRVQQLFGPPRLIEGGDPKAPGGHQEFGGSNS